MSRALARYIDLMEERPEEFYNTEAEYIIVKDIEKILEYEKRTGKVIGVVYESPYHLMVVDLVTIDGTKLFTYERLLPAIKKGAVVALTMYGENYVFLKQYRHALRGSQYSFPRGFAERGFSPEENLRKELIEELGCTAEEITLLGNVVADSGVSGVSVGIYLCKINFYEEYKHYEGIEKVIVLSRKELRDFIVSGKITDGFSLSALFLLDVVTKNKVSEH